MPVIGCTAAEPHPRVALAPWADSTAVSRLLRLWSEGEAAALDHLMPHVEGELRRLAQYFFATEPADHTLQPTALVNEIYLHLRQRRQVSWSDRAQFFGYAARAMRRLLVDHARLRRAEKRGGGEPRLPLEKAEAQAAREEHLLALDAALADLATLDPRQARIVELRFFTGLCEEEIAALLDLSARTVRRDWVTARLWLERALRHG